jgi:LacI family transcriptional regulator
MSRVGPTENKHLHYIFLDSGKVVRVMAATITEIAREANVSVPLVSRFLSDDTTLRITEEKRVRIEQAKAKLGGVRIRRAAANSSKKLTYNISMPVNHCFSPEWFKTNFGQTERFQAFVQTLKSQNFRVSINFFDSEKCLKYLKDVARSHCDGFLLGDGVVDGEISQWLLENQIPHVSTSSQDDKWEVNTVYDYVIGGMRQSIEHLLNLGHRHIGFVGIQERYPIFQLAITERQLAFQLDDWCRTDSLAADENVDCVRDHARQSFSQWFHPEQGPTAVICGNDFTALGVMDVLRERGLKPGKDLSIIGYDNIEQRFLKNCDHPILTTVDVPFDKIGQRYAERLLEQAVNGKWNIVHEQIPVKLVVRETTGICPTTD